MQTLSELKAENESANNQPPVDEIEVEEVTEDEQTEIEQQEEGESEGTTEELEWLKEDEDSASKTVPLSKFVEQKHKLKARLSEKDDELAALKAKIEALESGAVQKPVKSDSAPVLPTLEQFDYDESQYAAAMANYASDLVDHKLSQTLGGKEQEQQAQKAKQELDNKVNGHYERVASLVDGGVITADVYKTAESGFRRAVMQATGADEDYAEQLSDVLISRIGEGSEKVIPYIGRNKQAQARLIELMKNDPTGLDAMMFIGELKSKFGQAKQIKPTHSIEPDTPLSGSAARAKESTLKAEYTKAQNSGNSQKAWNIRKQARESGYNVNEW